MLGPVKPEDMRIADYQEAESLTVEWSAPVCPHSGYISHYILEYCRLDHDCGQLFSCGHIELLNVHMRTTALLSNVIIWATLIDQKHVNYQHSNIDVWKDDMTEAWYIMTTFGPAVQLADTPPPQSATLVLRPVQPTPGKLYTYFPSRWG